MSKGKKRKGNEQQTQPCRSAVAVQRAWGAAPWGQVQNVPVNQLPEPPKTLLDRQPVSSTNTPAQTENDKQPSTEPHNALPRDRSRSQRRSETRRSSAASAVSREASPSIEGQYKVDSESSLVDESRRSRSAQVKRLSTFSPDSNNIISDTPQKLHLKLRIGETLAVIGQFDLRVREGVVTFYGATFRKSPDTHRAFVPSTHSLPFIKCVSTGDGSGDSAEIEILDCKPGIRKLKRVSPCFGRIWNSKDKAGARGSTEAETAERSFTPFYQTTDDECKRNLTLLQMPETWDTLLFTVSRNKGHKVPLVLVCGPKGSGKSTFVRHLLNRILTSDQPSDRQSDVQSRGGAVLLDVDPGQPEFSPPGQLSLIHLRKPVLGPPFTHPNIFNSSSAEQIRAHSIATLSSNTDPGHFFACALDLLSKYRESLRLMPLVINCSGWVMGTGKELLQGLIRASSPTDVVYLSTSTHTAPDGLKECLKEGKIHNLPFHGVSLNMLNPASLRTMQTLSYFHSTKPQDGQLQWDPTPLTFQKPWIVRYDGRNPGILGIMTVTEVLSENQLFTVLDGALVAVVVLEDISAIPGYSDSGGAGINSKETSESGNNTTPGETSTNDPTLNQDGQNQPTTKQPVETEYPFIHRTTLENFPYLYADPTNPPLNPTKSYCIGMALVRAIDLSNHTLQLLTPISKDIVKDLMRKKSKIVLVCGKLDPPIWAYVEELAREVQDVKHQKKEKKTTTRKRRLGKLPWVAIVNGTAGNERGKGGELWRVRRNLPFKDFDDADE
ncbi:MAG: Polynucleotide 5'-hydroxyl-kinase grc3 [Peltula sp. TS41687]|nr:MAG: Polynucleotide 5'-hydroxyl-kinase grc3 [Peltula sp. TS41687]